jgi:hypothetical protein
MAEKPLPRRASGAFGNGLALLAIGDVAWQANVSSIPIRIEAAA